MGCPLNHVLLTDPCLCLEQVLYNMSILEDAADDDGACGLVKQ